MDEDREIDDLIKEQFKQLPKIVQQAIISADVEKELRKLAEAHKLHLDQWGTLEDQVQLTLLGIHHTDDLALNIQKEVGMSREDAESLATDISKIVFEPIRQELERQLEHPAAVEEKTSGVDDMRTQILADAASSVPPQSAPAAPAAPIAAPSVPATAPVIPATPPAPAPTATVERATIAPAYAAAASHERKTIEGDPYREQVE